MNTRLTGFISFLLLLAIAVFWGQQLDYRTFFYASAGGNRGRAAMIMVPQQIAAQNSLLIASHGTNSHKEVFLPVASLMAMCGVSSMMLDSSTLSTDEGISRRVEEIQAARVVIENGRSPFDRIIALGHSDGGPPSLAYMNVVNGKNGELIILGSQLAQKVSAQITATGFVGGFDQIFPAGDVIRDFQRNASHSCPVRVSWLSDHFTEQYDPILLAAIVEGLAGKDAAAKAYITPFMVGIGLLAFALAVILAFACGLVTGNPVRARSAYAIGFALFLWVSVANGSMSMYFAFPGVATLILFYLLGFNCGFVPTWQHLRPWVIFFVLMEINVVLGTAFFWENLNSALPWLPAFLLWYPFAWVCKLGLFGVSLMHRSFPVWMVDWHLPWLLLSILPLLSRRGIIPPFLSFFTSTPAARPASEAPASTGQMAQANQIATAGRQQTRLAVLLLLVMAGLWAIRFAQGMIQAEILQAVAGNFMRTLLLPCFYLIYLVFRKKNFNNDKAREIEF